MLIRVSEYGHVLVSRHDCRYVTSPAAVLDIDFALPAPELGSPPVQTTTVDVISSGQVRSLRTCSLRQRLIVYGLMAAQPVRLNLSCHCVSKLNIAFVRQIDAVISWFRLDLDATHSLNTGPEAKDEGNSCW